MSRDTVVDSLWASHQAGNYYPEQWRNKLSVETAYAAQLAILQQHLGAGATHVGWKVGLTADIVRAIYDATDPVFGYLLEDGGFRSGHSFQFDDLYPPLMETEILIILKQDIDAASATRDTVRAAIGTIAPAFEVPERRDGGLDVDFSLGLVDNVSQRAYVWGEEIQFSDDFEFGDVQLELEKNGKLEASVRGADVMDHQLDTLVWLAGALHQYETPLSAGQRIISGSFTKPAPVEKGDSYSARFSGVGDVSMSFK